MAGIEKNLIKLIQASAFAGNSGQSFRNNVLPTQAVLNMDSYRMTDYLVTSVAWTGSIPPSPGEVLPHASGTVFDVVATMTRGNQAFRIQNYESGFVNTIAPISGSVEGLSVTYDTFGVVGDGEAFNIGVKVISPLGGSPFPELNVAASGAMPEDYGVDWNLTWTTDVITGGGGGYTDVELDIVYNPDNVGFNSPLNNFNGFGVGWQFRMENRSYAVADIEFRVWNVLAGATDETNEGRLSGEGPFYGVSKGVNHPDNVNVILYWRWRIRGTLSWSAVQTSAFTDDIRFLE